MTIYWVMFAVPSLLSFTAHKSFRGRFNPIRIGVACFFVLVIGLRYQVGGDWDPYSSFFKEAIGNSLGEAVNYYSDPGYFLVNWLFANAGLGIWSINLLFAFVSFSGVMAIVKRQPMPWIALAVAVPYMLIVVSMGYVRQAVALGLLCRALVEVEDRRTWRFLLFALVAASFHRSAIVALPLFVLTLERIRLWHWLLIGLIVLGAAGVFVVETLQVQWANYVEDGMESEGAFIRVAMNMPAALIVLFFRERLGLAGHRGRAWFWIALVSISSIGLVNLASTAVDRLALYLLPLQIVVYGRVYRLFHTPVLRALASITVLAIYFCIQFVWLNYAKHADSWVPYQFYPLVGVRN